MKNSFSPVGHNLSALFNSTKTSMMLESQEKGIQVDIQTFDKERNSITETKRKTYGINELKKELTIGLFRFSNDDIIVKDFVKNLCGDKNKHNQVIKKYKDPLTGTEEKIHVLDIIGDYVRFSFNDDMWTFYTCSDKCREATVTEVLRVLRVKAAETKIPYRIFKSFDGKYYIKSVPFFFQEILPASMTQKKLNFKNKELYQAQYENNDTPLRQLYIHRELVAGIIGGKLSNASYETSFIYSDTYDYCDMIQKGIEKNYVSLVKERYASINSGEIKGKSIKEILKNYTTEEEFKNYEEESNINQQLYNSLSAFISEYPIHITRPEQIERGYMYINPRKLALSINLTKLVQLKNNKLYWNGIKSRKDFSTIINILCEALKDAIDKGMFYGLQYQATGGEFLENQDPEKEYILYFKKRFDIQKDKSLLFK